MTKCEGCGVELNPVYAAMDNLPVCMECVRARAVTAMTNRCKCGRKRNPGAAVTVGGYTVNGARRGGRTFVPCRRCLGTIKQLT